MNLFFLSQRNLLKQRRRYFFLAGAIAFGFAVLASLSLFITGMLQSLESKAAVYYGGNATVLGYAWSGNTRMGMAEEFESIKQAVVEVGGPGTAVSLRWVNRSSSTSLFFAGNSVRQRLVIGLDWVNEASHFRTLSLVDGDSASLGKADSIFISEPIAHELGAKIGDDILILLDTTNGERNTATLVVRGIVKDSSFLGYYTAYMDRRTLNKLVGNDENWADEISIFVDRRTDDVFYDRLQEALSKKIGMFGRIKEKENDVYSQLNRENPGWQGIKYALISLPAHLSQVRELVGAVEAVVALLQIILLLILVIGVTNTYRVIVNERRREIGTMRAMGLTKQGVLTLFCLESVWLATSGLIAGIVFCGIFVTIVSLFQFSWITGLDIFLLEGHLNVVLDGPLMLRNIAFLFAACLIGAILPAKKAVDMPPVDALRAQ